MLSDPSKSDRFRNAPEWRSPLLDFRLRVPQSRAGASLAGDAGAAAGPAFRSNSFSGHERNRLFLRGADGYTDVSLLSGVDCREDARSFATLDYDGDGWLDIALASCNAPRFRLFRNRMGDGATPTGVVSVRLEGSRSNRDAVGAVVVADDGRVFRRSIGEGLASQNSAALRIAPIGESPVRAITVKWPSGARTSHPAKAGEIRILEPESP